jgi:hypothetical protein
MAGAWLQAALEQAPNAEGGSNPTSSNVFYLKADSVKFDPGFKPLEEEKKMVGVLGRPKHLGVASYSPKVTIKGVSPRPADLGLILFLWAGACTTTPGGALVTDPDGNPVPTGAYKHVFSFAGDTPQTVRLLLKDAGGNYFKLTGGGVEKVGFTFGDGVFTYDADLIGLFGGPVTDPSLTPVYDAATPFRQGDMTLAWLTGSAETKAFDFALAAGLETDKGFSVVSDYPDIILFGNDEDSLPDISGTITKRTLDTDDWNALIGGTQFDAKIKLTHRELIGTTGRKAMLFLDLPGCQHVSDDPDDIANVRRRENKITWQARVDESTSTVCTATLINGTAAYASYGA